MCFGMRLSPRIAPFKVEKWTTLDFHHVGRLRLLGRDRPDHHVAVLGLFRCHNALRLAAPF
jgi:hypothetical protein